MSPGSGGIQVHLRVWSCCLDPHEQQPLHARHQGDGGDDYDGDLDDDDNHYQYIHDHKKHFCRLKKTVQSPSKHFQIFIGPRSPWSDLCVWSLKQTK